AEFFNGMHCVACRAPGFEEQPVGAGRKAVAVRENNRSGGRRHGEEDSIMDFNWYSASSASRGDSVSGCSLASASSTADGAAFGVDGGAANKSICASLARC